MNSFEEAKKHIETCNMCGGKMTYHRTIKNKYSGMLFWKLGSWAGGDAKFFAGLAVILPSLGFFLTLHNS